MASAAGDNELIQWVAVIVCIAAAAAFISFVQSGGFLRLAIDRAIHDGRVIPRMTREDVISSWGHPSGTEETGVQPLDVNIPVSEFWTYQDRGRIVCFDREGIVIGVIQCSGG